MGRFFGYARGSTNEQETTLQGQQEQLQAEYQLRYQRAGYEFGAIFTDRGVSGSLPLGQRPQGVRLMAELGDGDVLCLCKLDRGFRSLEDWVDVMRIFKQKNARLVLLDLQIDTASPIGQMVVAMLAAFAQLERAMIGQRIKEWARTQRMHGRPAGQAPYGFRSVGPRGKRKLERDDEARGLGAAIVEWLAAGWGVEQIRTHLQQHGYRGRNGWKMSRAGIYRMAGNERALQAWEAKQLTANESEIKES